MRVMVTVEARLIKAPDGNIYGKGPINYYFLRRYLEVFDEVVVLARVKEESRVNLKKLNPADGPDAKVFALPYYLGPWQYLRNRHKINRLVKRALSDADAYILRVPGTIGTILWRHLYKRKIPYGVEVVGDPWDSLAPGSVKSVIRPFVRRKMCWELVRQCQLASAASYVTEYSLQKRYPPGGWTTHCSSIELPNDVIIDEATLQRRIDRTNVKSNSCWKICYVGTMSQLYKAPDTLIEAASQCVHKGMDLELIMVGEGQFQPQLKEQARRLEIADRVKFLGRLLPGKDVLEQFDKADLFVLPSRQEGLPRTMIEAMARGLPCIGSNVGGIPELVNAEDLVPPNDPQALAEKITSVVTNKPRLEKMSRRNLQQVQKYRLTELTPRRIEFYEKVAERTEKWRRENPSR